MPADISSQSGPFGPFSWYLISKFVRSWMSASISALGHLEELIGVILSPPLSVLVELTIIFVGVIVIAGGVGAGNGADTGGGGGGWKFNC